MDPRAALGPDASRSCANVPRCHVTLLYDSLVAARWGEIQAYAQLRGRPRPANDSWIAAGCLVRDVPLVTFNTKDYIDFVEHEGPRTLT